MKNFFKYRPEIDGLRAVAVLAVIFFHAEFQTFAGGYVGVDVFFVISGYLISSIIISEIENKKFSISSFYQRRARRILPALICVIIISIPFAWYILLPTDLELLLELELVISGNKSLIEYLLVESESELGLNSTVSIFFRDFFP